MRFTRQLSNTFEFAVWIIGSQRDKIKKCINPPYEEENDALF